MRRFVMSAAVVSALSVASAASHAGVIPYPTPGQVAPQSAITAAATGDVLGYFVQGGAASGGGAADLDYVRLYDVTTGTFSPYSFNNQTSLAGNQVDFGPVNQGDELVFELENLTQEYVLASDASDSVDGYNYAYVTDFSGGTLNGASIPAGTYVGFEDESVTSGSDLNYQDDTFVFTNVSSAAVTPEPSSLALLGTGLVGALGVLRRRSA